MTFPSGPYRAETDNAVYNITFEDREIDGQPRYELIDKRILQSNPDALMVELAGGRPDSKKIDLLMKESKTKPPVFLVDVFPSKEQQAYTHSRQGFGMLVKKIGAAAVAALLIREAYLVMKNRSRGLQRVQSKAGIFFEKWYASKKVQDFLRRFRKKELELNPARRRFLKVGAVALLGLLSEGIDPLFGRQSPGFRGISERIDLLWKDFAVAGRNAVIAERLESFVAPNIRSAGGKKPEISVVMDFGHKGIMVQLAKPALRQKTLNTFREELSKLPAHSKHIGVYRFDPTRGKYNRTLEPDPRLVPKKVGLRESRRAPRRNIEDVQLTRRQGLDFFRKPFQRARRAFRT